MLKLKGNFYIQTRYRFDIYICVGYPPLEERRGMQIIEGQTVKDIFLKLTDMNIDSISSEELERLLPEFGMNNEMIHEMPKELSPYFGKGLRFWQYPNQFARLLKHIYGKPINSYLEIGCRWGGTFVIMNEVIKKSNKDLKSFAIDIIDQSEILKEYNEYSPFNYIRGNSMNFEWILKQLPAQVDFVFIDGDHSYKGVKNDFHNALALSPTHIMLHDINNVACPGVVQFWNEIKGNYTHKEFIEGYDSVKHNYLGIGIIDLSS